MRINSVLLLLSLITIPSLAIDRVEIELPPETFEDFSLPARFAAGIEWGSISVTGHDSTAVEVRATVTPEASASLSASEIRSLIDLDLVSAGNRKELVVRSRIEGFYGIDLDVRLPRETRVVLEMRRGGEIVVTDIDAEVDIDNRNGSVRLERLGGAAVVNARNGSIEARFRAVEPGIPMSFSTLNGSIDTTFPRDLDADLRIRYNRGGVVSDFEIRATPGDSASVDTDGLDARATRMLNGSIGDGGPRFYFHTANGTVYIRAANTADNE